MRKIFWIISITLTSFAWCQSPIPPGATLEKIATGFQFVEGPVWKDDVGLLFSDITPGIIYQWSKADSQITIHLKPSDSSNGLTFDRNGNLVLTQMRKRRISRQESSGTITPLVSSYTGKRFNSPNDLVYSSSGSLFFTDPDFNTPIGEPKELSIKGVFRLSSSNDLQVLDSTFDKPNGICFSPAGKVLYVNESAQRKIYSWDCVNDSTFINKKLLYTIPLSGYADGMKTDQQGNIYCTGPGAVWIISPSGTLLDKILVPENPSNCAWGESDRKTLYITAGKSIYRIRLNEATHVGEEGSRLQNSFELWPNFPNPCNPYTEIIFKVPRSGRARLSIFNILGQLEHFLFDEEVIGGRQYHITVDGRCYPSGAYFYSLESQGLRHSRSMLIVK